MFCKMKGTCSMESHGQRAKAYFLEGYNCAQSVLLAFTDELGLDRDTALLLTASFGGGMGRLREVCGTVSAILMAAGLLYGYREPKDLAGKRAHYQRVQELAGAFREKNGSIVCRELLGLPAGPNRPEPEERTPNYYKKRPCPDLVQDAADLLEAYMRTHPVRSCKDQEK